jgi:acyl-CoA dehydrogenase
MLKRYEDEGRPVGDQPLLAWAFHDSVNKMETALSGALRNFPIRPIGWLLWAVIFPFGRRAQEPSDRLGHRAASLLMTPCDARQRLADGVFLAPTPNNPAGRVDSYLPKVILAEPVERKFLKALKNSDIEALEFDAQLDEGVAEGWITAEERRQLEELRAMTLDAISVDDFEAWELRAASFERAVDASRAAA